MLLNNIYICVYMVGGGLATTLCPTLSTPWTQCVLCPARKGPLSCQAPL